MHSDRNPIAAYRRCVRTWNVYFEDIFDSLGRFIGAYPWPIIIIDVLIAIGLCFGITQYSIESNFFNLFLAKDSPVYKENEFIDKYWSSKSYDDIIISGYAKAGDTTDILDESYFYEWYQFHLDLLAHLPTINYVDEATQTNLTFGYFLADYYDPETLTVLSNKTGETVPHYASKILPLCRQFATSPLEAQFELPCYMTQILDCFTEGGYNFPYSSYLERTYLSSLYPTNPYDTKPSFQGMTSVELGKTIAPSCQVWSGTTIPSNYLYGGETRIDDSDETSQVLGLKTVQTIMFVDSSYNIARKIKIATGQCSYTSSYSIDCPPPSADEEAKTASLLLEWEKLFIDFMNEYVDKSNADDSKLLTYVFFTPRTQSDLLSQATSANIYLIIIAFLAMIVFASIRAFRPHNLFLSRSEVSCVGVLLVTLSVFATMGIGAVFWKFSANVLQVIPFIGLAFGVDDFFVILDSFRYRERLTAEEMTGEALRYSGTALTLSTLAIFFSFLVGTFIGLPDIERFCRFGIVLVILNYFLVLPAFVAVIALTIRRMKRGHRDCACLCCFHPCTKSKETHNETHAHHTVHFFDPLFDWLTQDSTRIGLTLAFFGLLGVGIYGCTLAQIGLPLANIVPTKSYAHRFLELRSKYYFAYVLSLYSDAHLNELKEIDWSNKFELWINETEQIYSVSDKIYTDSAVHDFWAWKLQAYLKTKWEVSFADYQITTFADSTFDTTTISSHIISSNCETDREYYCSSIFVDYSYGTSLYTCLNYNYDNLDSNCQAYLTQLKSENIDNSTSIAKQVQVTSNSSVDGLYVAPSTDTTNVYFKYSGDGVLYQRSDNTWYILDSNYDLVYYSGETETGAEPPQYGWYGTDDHVAAVSTIYWDESYKSYSRDPSVFLDYDIDARTSFSASYYFQRSDLNEGGCYALEVMQLAMQNIYSFNYTQLVSSATNHSVTCDAVLESSNLCRAISQKQNLGNVSCGTYERTSYRSHWWAGSCTNENFTIVGSNTASFIITEKDACSCQASVNNSLNLNYLSSCSFNNHNWGFYNGTQTSCANEDQQITLTCEAITTCDTLEVCYQDISTLAKTSSICTVDSITEYAKRGRTGGVAECLLKNYTSLSSCCQNAVNVEIIDRYTCANLSSYSGNSSYICTLKDSCDSTCNTICYNNLMADCTNEISSSYCYSYYLENNSTGLYNCLLNSTSKSSCCWQQLSDNSDSTSCIIPQDTYYNFNLKKYDYSNCQDIDWSSTTCGSSYNDTTQQLDCLLDTINSTTSSYCCHETLKLIQPSYVFTRDCQGDTKKWCSLDAAFAAANAACLQTLGNLRQSNNGVISTNCNSTLLYCPEDGDWPRTYINKTATINCAVTYSGNRTRKCTEVNKVATWSSVINETGCTLQSCNAETDSKNQYWDSSYVGYVQHYIGSYEVSSKYSVKNCNLVYLQRLCYINTTNNTAVWQSPVYWCRGSYGSWGTPYNGSYCNPETASLIETYDASSSGDVASQISTCKTACSSGLSHCVGFIYERNSSLCYFYDYCELETYTNPALSNSNLFWYAPETLSETVATYCSGNGGFKPSEAYSSNGIPNATCFNDTLLQYLLDPAGGVLYQDKFVLNNDTYLYNYIVGLDYMQLRTTYNQISVKDLTDEAAGAQFIIDIRNWLDNTMYPQGLYVIPGGLIINLFSEYIHITSILAKNLIYVAIAITLCAFFFLLNAWAVFILMICNVAMTVEVYGFLNWVSLRVNGVFILNIMIAVGTTFIFSAHIGRAFVITTVKPEDHARSMAIPYASDGQIRMKKALRDMFSAVSLGALTTFIGVLPIVGSTFPYFKQYYFILYLLIIVFGWVNGVIFQPVFLSWFPPTPFLAFSQQKESITTNLRDSNVQLSVPMESVGNASPNDLIKPTETGDNKL